MFTHSCVVFFLTIRLSTLHHQTSVFAIFKWSTSKWQVWGCAVAMHLVFCRNAPWHCVLSQCTLCFVAMHLVFCCNAPCVLLQCTLCFVAMHHDIVFCCNAPCVLLQCTLCFVAMHSSRWYDLEIQHTGQLLVCMSMLFFSLLLFDKILLAVALLIGSLQGTLYNNWKKKKRMLRREKRPNVPKKTQSGVVFSDT